MGFCKQAEEQNKEAKETAKRFDQASLRWFCSLSRNWHFLREIKWTFQRRPLTRMKKRYEVKVEVSVNWEINLIMTWYRFRRFLRGRKRNLNGVKWLKGDQSWSCLFWRH